MFLPLCSLVAPKRALSSPTSYWLEQDSTPPVLLVVIPKEALFNLDSYWSEQDCTAPCPTSMSTSKPQSLYPEDGGGINVL